MPLLFDIFFKEGNLFIPFLFDRTGLLHTIVLTELFFGLILSLGGFIDFDLGNLIIFNLTLAVVFSPLSFV